MNSRLIIIIAAVAALGGVLWLGLHRTRQLPAPSAETQKGSSSESPTQRVHAGRSKADPASDSSTSSRYAVSAVSAPVQRILDTHQGYLLRSAAISELSTNLSAADWSATRDFLLQKDPFDEDQLGRVLKNKLLDALCLLNPSPDGLGDLLTRMFRDGNQDVVIRDYAVQHLAAYYEQLQLISPNDLPGQRAVQEVLWEALAETDNSIAGTALLALERLSADRAEFDRTRISGAAVKLARDENTGELARISAFQICGRMGINEAAPILFEAASNELNVPLRIAAIGALGALGDSQAIPLLTNLVNGTEERLKLPAQHALEQIELQEKEKGVGTAPKI